jgi:cell wall-associated NlpC family hydrolase
MTDLLKLCDSLVCSVGGLPPQTPAASRRALRGLEAAIIEEARTWLGTPFKHQGRMKNVGVDCLGLLIGVAAALDLRSRTGQSLADLDSLGYGHFPDEAALRAGLASALWPVGELSAGCIVLMKIEGRTQHLGIVGNYEEGELSLIHAYAPHRKVVEHRLSEDWRGRIVAIFKNDNAGQALQTSDVGGEC